MIDLNVKIDTRRIERDLKGSFQAIGDYGVPFKRSGTLMLRSIDKNFRGEVEPDKKKKWKALKPATLKRRKGGGKGGKILQDTGQMRSSVNFKAEGTNKLVLNANRKADGVDIVAVHQKGSKKRNIPARPFLGFSSQDADDIARIFSKWAAEILKTK